MEPNIDKEVVFEDFSNAGLGMPPHLTLAEIMLKFKIQLHQLNPNAIVQLSNFFWVVASWGCQNTMSFTINERKSRKAMKPSTFNLDVLPFIQNDMGIE
jgi:hypothetical protein